MTNYLFIESRDPFESHDPQFVETAAIGLRQHGHDVTVFLVQNGVLASRKNVDAAYLDRLADSRVKVLADDFSLQERGIANDELRRGVQPSTIEVLVDLLIQDQTKAVWH